MKRKGSKSSFSKLIIAVSSPPAPIIPSFSPFSLAHWPWVPIPRETGKLYEDPSLEASLLSGSDIREAFQGGMGWQQCASWSQSVLVILAPWSPILALAALWERKQHVACVTYSKTK